MPLGGLGTMTAIGVASQAIPAIISGIRGIGQKARGKKLEKSLKTPQYNIPQEILANKQLAELQANQGMPAQQYAQAQKNIERSQANALGAATDRRGGLSAIGGITDRTNQALGGLDAQSAAMRLQNIGNLMRQNQVLGEYRDKAFDINVMQPYEYNLSKANALKTAGEANINQGLSGLFGAGATAATSGLFGGGGTKPTAQSFDYNSFMQNAPKLDASLKPQMSLPPVFTPRPIMPYRSTLDAGNVENDLSMQSMNEMPLINWNRKI